MFQGFLVGAVFLPCQLHRPPIKLRRHLEGFSRWTTHRHQRLGQRGQFCLLIHTFQLTTRGRQNGEKFNGTPGARAGIPEEGILIPW